MSRRKLITAPTVSRGSNAPKGSQAGCPIRSPRANTARECGLAVIRLAAVGGTRSARTGPAPGAGSNRDYRMTQKRFFLLSPAYLCFIRNPANFTMQSRNHEIVKSSQIGPSLFHPYRKRSSNSSVVACFSNSVMVIISASRCFCFPSISRSLSFTSSNGWTVVACGPPLRM